MSEHGERELRRRFALQDDPVFDQRSAPTAAVSGRRRRRWVTALVAGTIVMGLGFAVTVVVLRRPALSGGPASTAGSVSAGAGVSSTGGPVATVQGWAPSRAELLWSQDRVTWVPITPARAREFGWPRATSPAAALAQDGLQPVDLAALSDAKATAYRTASGSAVVAVVIAIDDPALGHLDIIVRARQGASDEQQIAEECTYNPECVRVPTGDGAPALFGRRSRGFTTLTIARHGEEINVVGAKGRLTLDVARAVAARWGRTPTGGRFFGAEAGPRRLHPPLTERSRSGWR